eukprot:snap_masked-scaffold_1-processed-gene-1.19-mRNA-1 protein AED:1.00 eAED:1.00 QI:0/0/0/0/1/1/4/0/1059
MNQNETFAVGYASSPDDLLSMLQKDNHLAISYQPLFVLGEDETFKRRLLGVLKVSHVLQDLSLELKEAPTTVHEIGKVLFQQNPLVIVRLLSIDIHQQTGADWAVALKGNQKLKELSFRYSSFNSAAFKQITKALAGTRLMSLDLYHTQIGLVKTNLISLGSLLEETETLADLCLDYCEIVPSSAFKVFAASLKKNNTVSTLSLLQNNLGNKGVSELCKSLKNNYTVTSLNLSYCRIGQDGGLSIADLLASNKEILYIYLNYNEITDLAFCEIGKSLETNSNLLEIFCIRNHLTSNCVRYLTNLVLNNSTLLTICMSDNFSLRRGADSETLLSALGTNKCLTDLQVGGDKEVEDSINDLLLINLKMKKELFKNLVAKQNTQTSWNKVKLVVLGEARCGKTATIRSLLGDSFKEELASTLGTSVQTAVAKFHHDVARKWERLESRAVYSKVHANQLVSKVLYTPQSVTSTPESHELVAQYEKKKSAAHRSRQIKKPVMKLPRRRGQNKRVRKKQNTLEEKFDPKLIIEGNSKDTNVDFTVLDYAGQETFYSFHQTFFTNSGIIMILFNLEHFSKVVKKVEPFLKKIAKQIQKYPNKNVKNLETLISFRQQWPILKSFKCVRQVIFWLRNVSFFCPDSEVVLVGTFLDRTKSDKVLRQINELFAFFYWDLGLRSMNLNVPEKQPSSRLRMFYHPVENVNLKGLVDLKDTIKRVALQKMNLLRKQIPLKYMFCLDALLNFENEENENYVSFDGFLKICSKYSVNAVNEVKNMLKLFTEKGIVTYLDRNTLLSSSIIIKPHWLLQSISVVIRDPEYHFDFNTDMFKNAGLLSSYYKWRDEAIVSYDLIEFVLKTQETIKKNKEVEFLVEYMQSVLLIAKYSEAEYIIPSMLPLKTVPPDDSTYIGCFFELKENFIPQSTFQRLVCLFIEFFNAMESSDVWFQTSKEWIIVCHGEIRKLVLRQVDGGVRMLFCENQQLEFVQKVYSASQSFFEKISTEALREKLVWTTKFYSQPRKITEFVEDELIDEEDARNRCLEPWFLERVLATEHLGEVSIGLTDFLDEF